MPKDSTEVEMDKLLRNSLMIMIIVMGSILLLAGGSQKNPFGANSAVAAADDSETQYDVKIDPEDFVSVIDNPYMPLIPGTTRIYESETEDGLERTEVTVLQETKVVMGVTTTVVRDTVYLDGQLIEDTLDWFAQDEDGTVWYLGEAVDNYEDGVLVDHDGSWEAGVDGALPGIVMHDEPEEHLRERYRQEYYPGIAEDMAKILNVDVTVTVPYGTFDDVLKTKDWTPLEPGVAEHKYYAEGIGLIKEVDLRTGEENVLIEVIPGPTEDDDDDDDDDDD
jgi:hypothetical protein